LTPAIKWLAWSRPPAQYRAATAGRTGIHAWRCLAFAFGLPFAFSTGVSMKLYYSPGACSLSPHIALRESGLAFELVRTSTKTHQLEDGTDFYTINPKGSVPVLEIANGERLTEGPAIVQYIADQVPQKQLAPANGTMARYRLQEWLNFITSELHKSFSPLFKPGTLPETKEQFKAQITKRLQWVDSQLAGKAFLLGDTFSVADAYLYTVVNWTKPVGIPTDELPDLLSFMARVGARPAVVEALKAEGLV
jgi:glutathione S-transferase